MQSDRIRPRDNNEAEWEFITHAGMILSHSEGSMLIRSLGAERTYLSWGSESTESPQQDVETGRAS